MKSEGTIYDDYCPYCLTTTKHRWSNENGGGGRCMLCRTPSAQKGDEGGLCVLLFVILAVTVGVALIFWR